MVASPAAWPCHSAIIVSGFDQWLTTIMQPLAHLSKPQATVFALWNFGMVLVCSCTRTAWRVSARRHGGNVGVTQCG
jgi:hypothetical protein